MSNKNKEKMTTLTGLERYMLRNSKGDKGSESVDSLNDVSDNGAVLKAINALEVKLQQSEERILQTIREEFSGRITDVEKSLENAHAQIDELKTENKSILSELFKERDEKEELQRTVAKLDSDILILKRNAVEYNVRIPGIAEEKFENCKDKVVEYIVESEIFGDKITKDEVCNMFDSAFRIGKKEEGKNRQILAHCLCKDLRNTLIKKGKRKGQKGQNLILEDFIREEFMKWEFMKYKIRLLCIKYTSEKKKETTGHRENITYKDVKFTDEVR